MVGGMVGEKKASGTAWAMVWGFCKDDGTPVPLAEATKIEAQVPVYLPKAEGFCGVYAVKLTVAGGKITAAAVSP